MLQELFAYVNLNKANCTLCSSFYILIAQTNLLLAFLFQCNNFSSFYSQAFISLMIFLATSRAASVCYFFLLSRCYFSKILSSLLEGSPLFFLFLICFAFLAFLPGAYTSSSDSAFSLPPRLQKPSSPLLSASRSSSSLCLGTNYLDSSYDI